MGFGETFFRESLDLSFRKKTLHILLFINFLFQAEAGNYKQRAHPHVHIFGPSIATTNYMTSSLSDLLKSIGCKNAVQIDDVKKNRMSLRDHHSHSPMRLNTKKVGQTRTRSPVE